MNIWEAPYNELWDYLPVKNPEFEIRHLGASWRRRKEIYAQDCMYQFWRWWCYGLSWSFKHELTLSSISPWMLVYIKKMSAETFVSFAPLIGDEFVLMHNNGRPQIWQKLWPITWMGIYRYDRMVSLQSPGPEYYRTSFECTSAQGQKSTENHYKPSKRTLWRIWKDSSKMY